MDSASVKVLCRLQVVEKDVTMEFGPGDEQCVVEMEKMDQTESN